MIGITGTLMSLVKLALIALLLQNLQELHYYQVNKIANRMKSTIIGM